VGTLAVALVSLLYILYTLIYFCRSSIYIIRLFSCITFAIQETMRPVASAELGATWETLAAYLHGVRTARVETTTGRRIYQAGDLSSRRK